MAEGNEKGVHFTSSGKTAPDNAGGRNHVLVIAIDTYKKNPLQNCVADAEALIAVLTSRYGFQAEDIIKLYNEQATRRKIEHCLLEMKKKVKPADNFFLFFSGHGEREEDIHYLVPVEAEPEEPGDFYPVSHFKDRIGRIPSFHTVVILDSCYSGGLFIEGTRDFKDLDLGAEQYRSRWGLAACHTRERAFDGRPGENSPFSRSLIELLSKAEGSLGIQQLGAQVAQMVRNQTDPPQTVIVRPLAIRGDEQGQYVFRPKADPQTLRRQAWTAIAALPEDTEAQLALKIHALFAFVEQAQADEDLEPAYQMGKYLEQKREFVLAQSSLFDLQRYATRPGLFQEEARKLLEDRKKGLILPPEPWAETVRPVAWPAQSRDPQPPSDRMVLIPAGKFDMGDVMGDNEYDDEKPLHQVALSGFYMSRHALSFEEYDAFCEATGRDKPSDEGWGRGQRPVINVNWYDAVEYCNWLSEFQGFSPAYRIDKQQKDPNNQNKDDEWKWTVSCDFSAGGYRLPTEAEWEYAARECGKKRRFGNGKDVADPREIHFDPSEKYKKSYSMVGEYRQKTVEVGSLNSPNALGLHHMSGNVWEWCWDWFDQNYYGACATKGLVENPVGPERGVTRVLRGGGWIAHPGHCRASYRGHVRPWIRGSVGGFRVVSSLQLGGGS